MTDKNLGLLSEALTAAGMGISYAYEDLVFLEHNGFLLQFSDTPDEVLIHINTEAEPEDLSSVLALFQTKAAELNLRCNLAGHYRVDKTEQEHIQIEFFNTMKVS